MTCTVRADERRGVAGLHIEDQRFPKKCGDLDNKALVSLDEYPAKIVRLSLAKRDPDSYIIARTESRAALGFEERSAAPMPALAAGADTAFVEAPHSVEEVAACGAS